jgi:hypothetical protein
MDVFVVEGIKEKFEKKRKTSNSLTRKADREAIPP